MSFLNQARSGHWPFSNIIRYSAEIGAQAYDVYLTDYRIVNSGRDDRALEALTRRIYTDNPNAVIISPIIPENVNGDGSVDALSAENIASAALAAHYGVHLVDYRQAVIDLVAGGALLSTYMSDSIHPTATGQALIAEMIEAAIVANGWLAGENHATLPARLHDDGTFESEPTRINGADHGGVTGSWTTTDTRIESSSAGATVTFSATCSQFGLYNASSGYVNTTVDVQIDGGDWLLDQVVTHNGWYGGTLDYGAHTFVFRIPVAGNARIDEFWAI